MFTPKPKRGSHKRPRRQRRLAKSRNKKRVRATLFPEDQIVRCACCRFRRAQTMHEIKPESVGGVASAENSIPVCGTGTTGCHGYLQQNAIRVEQIGDHRHFVPHTPAARRWLGLKETGWAA